MWWTKRKTKNQKKKVPHYRLSDIRPTLAGYEMSPITDPFLIDVALEALKPASLPEQKVFDSIEDLEKSL